MHDLWLCTSTENNNTHFDLGSTPIEKWSLHDIRCFEFRRVMTTGSGNNDETEEDDPSQKTPLSLASSTISDDANEGN